MSSYMLYNKRSDQETLILQKYSTNLLEQNISQKLEKFTPIPAVLQ